MKLIIENSKEIIQLTEEGDSLLSIYDMESFSTMDPIPVGKSHKNEDIEDELSCLHPD